VTLVLSGGGARGAAHLGVLEVLEELHVPVARIVGTSMGALVGGLYASGWSPAEIEQLLLEHDWRELLGDRGNREYKSFRRKQDDRAFLVPTKMRLRGWKPYIPPGLVAGQRLELLLRSAEIAAGSPDDFDAFPIPFRAVASDLVRAEPVVLDRGSLATALRASMAITGVLAPVELDGRTLTDGGLVANLPIGIARELGPEPIVAVDITSPLLSQEELSSLFSVLNQMTNLLTTDNRAEDLERLRPGDVLVQPELGTMSMVDFDELQQAIELGRQAARARADALRAFAVSPADYAAFHARLRRPAADQLVVDALHVENTSWVADPVVQRRLDLPTGVFDAAVVERALLRLRGLDYFGVVRERFTRVDGQGTLTVEAPRRPSGRNSLQFGLSLADDFAGDTSYALAVRHLMLAANRRGGEWENVGQIGETTVLSSAFYQPLDYGLRWFVSPGGAYRRVQQQLWVDGRPVSELRVKSGEGRLDVGRVLGDWGELRLSAFHSSNAGHVRLGEPAIADFNLHDGGLRLSFRVDTLDQAIFPRHGTDLELAYAGSRAGLGSDVDYRRLSLAAARSFSFGRNTLTPALEVGVNLDPVDTPLALFPLGGFLRLSGLGRGELFEANSGFVRLLYYRELRRFDLGALSSKLLAGLSLEAGNVYADDAAVTWRSLHHGGAVFLGAETVLGPAYLGYGVTDGERNRIYLIIGQRL
ncbi:MAG TPA: patatin-like phospholipase family protein, partial [Candidatus Polarisedimenticolaceae bacterium]|nr:patatin-like phospholipase family protein [Candidatus Polarisedimenticolaceae bacterium]